MKQKTESASYAADFLLIKLPPDVADGIFDVDSQGKVSIDLTNWSLAGFLFHEWIHYLHNVSTLNGVYAFASMVNMWANFRHKLDRSGKSVEANTISEYAESSVRRTHAYRKKAARYERNMTSVLRESTNSLKIQTVEAITEDLPQLLDHQVEHVSVLSCETEGSPDEASIRFEVGPVEILEGIAFMLEEKFLMIRGELPTNVKTAPYRLLQSIARHVVCDIEDDCVIAAALTALQTDDPPLALLTILRDLSKKADNERMAWLENLLRGYLAAYRSLIDDALIQTIQLFPVTEPMGEAVKDVARIIRQNIKWREETPFLELLMLQRLKSENEETLPERLLYVMANYSCARILARAPRGAPSATLDQVYHLGAPPTSPHLLFGAQKLHSALHFLSLHLSDDGFVATTSISASKERKCCPFYTACDYQLRHEKPDLCADRPWESLAIETDPANECWYRAGVRVTRRPEGDFDPDSC